MERMLLEAEAPQAFTGPCAASMWKRAFERGQGRMTTSVSVCVRYRLRRLGGEGIVKATRPAEGEGGDAFSLFRLSSNPLRLTSKKSRRVRLTPSARKAATTRHSEACWCCQGFLHALRISPELDCSCCLDGQGVGHPTPLFPRVGYPAPPMKVA